LALTKVKNLPISEIVLMKIENSFQNSLTEVNYFNISYNGVGEESIAVIFFYGLPSVRSMGRKQLDNLKSAYRTIPCALRGFGKLTNEESQPSFAFFREYLIPFMEKLNNKKALVFGLSLSWFNTLNGKIYFPKRFEPSIIYPALTQIDLLPNLNSSKVNALRIAVIGQWIESELDYYRCRIMPPSMHFRLNKIKRNWL